MAAFSGTWNISKLELLVGVSSFVLLVVACLWTWTEKKGANQPPSLDGSMIYNTYQYMTDMQGFLHRVDKAQRSSSVVKFRLGPKLLYMISGEKNIQEINKPSSSISPDVFFLEVMANVWGAKKSEVARFDQDKSGRNKNPLPGRDVKPGQTRLWHGQHHVYTEYLQKTEHSNNLADKYYELLSDRLFKQPLNEWRELSLGQFFESDMAEAALVALMGQRILDVNPGFWPTMWEFARLAPQLMWGLPQWLNSPPWQVRKQFHGMCKKFLDAAADDFDWNGPGADANWEPLYGSKMSRELIRWATTNLSQETTAGMVATFIFGTNANSVPMCTWAMMEIIADPELYAAVREECNAATVTDPLTGKRGFDAQKLLSMPLLQSIYVETLRLHVSINVTREITEPVTLDGHVLEPGALIQAPSQIGQYNESVWNVDGKHPASEFWAWRHVRHDGDGGEPTFSLSGRTSSFFPFGGGSSICPGRVFAKREIIMTIAILATRFDIEMVAWTQRTLTGEVKSDRPPRNDQSYIGAVGIPPDRDMKVRWKRLW